MTTRIVLGVDPGATGAIAAVFPDGRLLSVGDMPVADRQVAIPLLRTMTDHLADNGYEITAVAIEKVHSMPRQGVATTFQFGRNYGVVLGYFGAFWRIVDVPPQTWKKRFALCGKDKDAARAYAIQCWPDSAEGFARKKDVGRADAALIGLWLAETQSIAQGAVA